MTDEVTIPAGMKPWAGGLNAPADFASPGGKVQLRSGYIVNGAYRWTHYGDEYPDGTAETDVVAYTPMTPEPAQPAESPEARAVTLAECPIGLFTCMGELCLKTEYGNNEGRIDAYIVSSGEFFWGKPPQSIANQRQQMVVPVDADAMLAATTARPTERGAVPFEPTEAMRQAGEAVEHDGSVSQIWREMYAVAQPATVQAAEVTRLREALEEARRQLEYMDERSPSGTTPAVIARIDAALATQPATGRTMGGEDGLRAALEDIETMLTPAGNVWLGTEPKWQTDAYARARAALQNGGE